MEKEKLVELGSAHRPHGIKGGFQFKLINEKDSILKKNMEIILFPKTSLSSISRDGESVKIENIHFGNKVICYFAGITDRNIVEQMLPFQIFLEREKFPNLDEGEFYLSDLIGLKVVNTEGQELGSVESQYDNGAQAVLKLRLKNEIIELPFVKNFFPDINMDEKTITFVAPEYDE